MKERVEELRTRKEQALHARSRQAVEVQHDKGKLTARERIDGLLDPGSFVETDMLATHRSTAFGMDKRRIPGDGVVTGYGTIGGRRDFTVFGGSLGEVMAEKICKVMDLSLKMGVPCIDINDSGGPHPGGRGRPLRLRRDLLARPGLRGRPPAVADHGPLGGRGGLLPAITDFVLMVKETSTCSSPAPTW